MDGRPEGELTLRGLHFMVDAPEGLLTPFGLFTATPVYATRFTFHGLWLSQFMLRSLRFAVDISLLTPSGLFTATPVYAPQFTFHGLRFAVYGCAGQSSYYNN